MTCFIKDGQTVKKYCEKNNLSYDRFFYWINKGLSVDESLDKIRSNSHHGRKWEYNGESIFIYCRKNNLLYNSVVRSIKKGMSVDEALEKSRKLRHKRGRPRKYEIDGLSVRDFCKREGLTIGKAYYGIIKGEKNV